MLVDKLPLLEKPMFRPDLRRDGRHPAPPLLVNDLCAQLAPLDRYGLPGLSSALVDGLVALLNASRNALCACDSRAGS